MGVTATTLLHWLLALLALMVYASAALPLIMALELIFGRRGNGRFCLFGTARLLDFALCLSISGLCYYPLSYLSQILVFDSRVSLWAPFFSLPGMPWSSALLAWITGFLILMACRMLFPASPPGPQDKYPFKFIKKPFSALLGAAFCFWGSFMLVRWPFAGLPQGLDLERAALAIAHDAFRHYFMAFSPAGAFSLAYIAVNLRALEQTATAWQISMAFRWFAFWAALGYIPGLLQNWAVAMGLGYRGALSSHLATSFFAQITGMSLLTAAIVCWAVAALKKEPLPLLAWLGLALLIFKESLPFILKLSLAGA